MKSYEFYDRLRRKARLSDEEAVRAAKATLCTLGERLPQGELFQLAVHLPNELRSMLLAKKNSGPHNMEEFYQRVADRAGINYVEAMEWSRAVFAVLKEAASPEPCEEPEESRKAG